MLPLRTKDQISCHKGLLCECPSVKQQSLRRLSDAGKCIVPCCEVSLCRCRDLSFISWQNHRKQVVVANGVTYRVTMTPNKRPFFMLLWCQERPGHRHWKKRKWQDLMPWSRIWFRYLLETYSAARIFWMYLLLRLCVSALL